MRERKRTTNVKYKIHFPIKLSLILVVSSVISAIIFQKFVSQSIGDYANARIVLKSVKDFLIPSLWFSITIFTLLLSLGTILLSIVVSHKIAGPLYRLETTFKDFSKGFYYTITLRPGDHAQELASHVNEFVESLSTNFSSAKKLAIRMGELIDKGKSECGAQDIDYKQLQSLNAELSSASKELSDILSIYKTQ